jgi:hypothetical protein
MDEDSGGCRRNGLAILELVREEAKISEKQILVMLGFGVGVVTDNDNVRDDGLEVSSSERLGVAIGELKGRLRIK